MSFVPLQHDNERPTGIIQTLRSTGWRRTGAWNILAASVAGIILLCCLIASISQPGSSFQDDTLLFHGSCETSRYLNIWLHLMINLVSSAVLASSNYFMQILNAPSRREIDQAHFTLSSLEIGIPSLRNMRFLSSFKKWFWALLIITSLPVHFFFNSSVYETSFEGSTWQLTIAAEDFLHGSQFFPPGAKLAPAGSASPIVYSPHWNGSETHRGYYDRYGDNITAMPDYWDDSSAVRKTLAEIPRNAATGEREHRWANLTSRECHLEYAACKPRNKYGDVVVVVETGAHASGWTRAEVYSDLQGMLPDWKSHIPTNEINSLWYSTKCEARYYVRDKVGEGAPLCDSDNAAPCIGLLGMIRDAERDNYQQENWTITFSNSSAAGQHWDGLFGYDTRFNHLEVRYCLADLAPSKSCKVIVANNLIGVTLLCVLFKVLICTVVVLRLPAESLVTPGDAINSFLTKPDAATRGLGAIDSHDAHRLESTLPYPLGRACKEYDTLLSTPQARTWRQKKRKIRTAMPRSAWWRVYAPIISSLVVVLVMTLLAYWGNEDSFGSSFGHWGDTSVTHLGITAQLSRLLLANLGQVVLSWCYFLLNSLLTRIHVEKEINLYSRSFKPLRVSFPKGEQVATWRLQLPYRFGIPLLLTSIILHWLASNSIFILIMEGGYYRVNPYYDEQPVNHLIPDGSYVVLGFSTEAILTTLVLGTTLATIPLLLCFFKLPGDMVTGGSNSLVLSAACHAVYPNQHVPDTGDGTSTTVAETDDETRSLNEQNRNARQIDMWENTDDIALQDDNPLVKLARSKLRWGVTPLTPELRDIVQETGQEALHLTFATEDTFISPPVEGELYL